MIALRITYWGQHSSNKWQSTLKSTLFGIDMTIPELLKLDGSLTQESKEMATLFADVLDRKQSNDRLTIPQTCFPEGKFTSLVFRSREIKNLLNDHNANGGAGLDAIFLLFLKVAADILSSKIAVIFRKYARAGTFCTCWRVSNVTLLCKC